MAKKKQNINTNANQAPMGFPPVGFGAPASTSIQAKGKGKGKKKANSRKQQEMRAMRIERAKTLRSRQEFAVENVNFRKKIEDVQGSGTLDNTRYKLPADIKPKKRKDHFFIMRKATSFIMFLILLVSVAFYALSYLKLEMIPNEYTALFVDAPIVLPEGEEAEEAEETEDAIDESVKTNLLDPVFGFIKYISNKFNMNVELGESPLYDSLIAKVEVGMTDNLAMYAILAFPVAIIIYAIIALVMMLKALFGIFGKKVYKKFGLGSILMIVCGGITALGGLAATVDFGEKMVYADVVDIIIGGVTNTGGFTGGYGLLILIALPVLVLILSMFAKKKIPYSIFDNISV